MEVCLLPDLTSFRSGTNIRVGVQDAARPRTGPSPPVFFQGSHLNELPFALFSGHGYLNKGGS